MGYEILVVTSSLEGREYLEHPRATADAGLYRACTILSRAFYGVEHDELARNASGEQSKIFGNP